MGFKKWMVATLVVLGMLTAAHGQSMRIQYAEPVAIAARAGSAQFEAYGQRFDLDLASNERLIGGLPAARKATLATTRLLRGTVQGRPGSWVRLSVRGGVLAGAIWDGTDFYIVARYAEVAPHLTTPLALTADQAVVYRLSDTLDFLPHDFCATEPAGRVGRPSARNGLEQFKALVGELKLQFVNAPTDQLDISLIADAALQELYSPTDDLPGAMLALLNVVDGIYDAQLGLVINAADLRLAPTSPDPFTSDDSEVLLGQLKTFRSSIPEVQSKAVAHLLTRRVLDDGTTLGIAALEGACDATDGVSLTSTGGGVGASSRQAMIVAHEIGHNLGAHHDTAACGDTFLMWPANTNSTTPVFSQCSLDEMRPFIAARRGNCFTSPVWADAEARIGAISDPLVNEPFTWPVYVRNAGTAPLANSVVDMNLYGADIGTVTTTVGSCASSNGHVSCQFGTLAPGAEARVDLEITPNFLGALQLIAHANGGNDRYENNNIVYGNSTVRPQATLSISVNPATQSALVGDTVTYTYTLTSSGPRPARNVSVRLGGNYFDGSGVSTTQGSCVLSAVSSTCDIGDIPAGSSVDVVFDGHATQAGNRQVGAQVTASAYIAQPVVNGTLVASARRDLELVASAGLHYPVVDSPYELTFPIRANGTQAVTDGRFRMNSGGATVQSVTIDGVSCASSDYHAIYGGGCPLGIVNPGEQRMVTVRLLFTTAMTTNVALMAETASGDDLGSNNQVDLEFQARNGTDVSVSVFGSGSAQIEGRDLNIWADIFSIGANDATQISATLDVPVGMRVLTATLPQGDCALANERRITCTRGTLARNATARMTATVIGDEPASFTVTYSVNALNDGASANNTATSQVLVRPLADVGVNPLSTTSFAFVIGVPRDFTFEVFTGQTRPVQGVTVRVPNSQRIPLESLSAAVGTCSVTAGTCNLGDLLPNSLVQINARYTATGLVVISDNVSVSAPWDADNSNNWRSIMFNSFNPGDARLSVVTTHISGNVGAVIDLPRITIDTLLESAGGEIEIVLPSFVTIDRISFSGGICSGSTPLRCYMGSRATGARDDIDIRVRVDGAGTFTSNITVKMSNDTNPANDQATLQIQGIAREAPPVTPPSSGSSSSGGKGGGGRFEWLAVALLALLVTRRMSARAHGSGTPRRAVHRRVSTPPYVARK